MEAKIKVSIFMRKWRHLTLLFNIMYLFKIYTFDGQKKLSVGEPKKKTNMDKLFSIGLTDTRTSIDKYKDTAMVAQYSIVRHNNSYIC